MTNTPWFITPVHKAPGLSPERRELEGKKYLKALEKATLAAEKDPLDCAGKTAEERQRIMMINMYDGLNRAMKKMSAEGAIAFVDVRDWACLSGYQSIVATSPVPDKDVVDLAHEVWRAYTNRPKNEDGTTDWSKPTES